VAILAGFASAFIEYIAYDIFDGTSTGSWNCAMAPMVDQMESCRAENLKEARRIAGLLYKLHHFVHEDKVHHNLRYKIAAWLRGRIPSPYMRPPMPPPGREEVLTMREVLKGAGFSVISNEEIDATLNNRI